MHCSERKMDGRPLGPDAPHYPGKLEGEILRRMMAESGLTKDELLANKDNRKKLANELKQPAGNPEKRLQLEIKNVKRRIAAKLDLPAWRPEVLDEFNKTYEVSRAYGTYRLRYR